MLSLLLLGAFAQVPPYECRFTDGPIVVDGKLDDAAWKHAAPVGEFRRHWLGADAKPKAGGRARLLWDRSYLYFAADFDDDDLFAPLTEHDSKTWYNDVFEMFLKPSRHKPGYFEFHVTPRNTRMDLFIPDRSNWNFDVQVKKEKFEWETKVARRGTLEPGDRDEGWTVEGRIPWKDFAATARRPEPGEVWTFALCRYNYKHGGGDPETSSVAKLTKYDFHRYEDFDALRFAPPAESPGAKVHALPKPAPLTTSKVQGFPDPPLPFRAKRRWENLRPNFPIVARFEPNSDRLWYVDEPGGSYAPTRLHRVVPETGKPELLVDTTPFGSTVYDICFHPKFAENGYVYLGLNEPVGDKKVLHTRIVRYRVDPKPPHTFDAKSRTAIIDWPSNGHAGGAAAFDANGLLYVTSGDGTSESDLDLVGQDLTRIQAKVLRIDVDRPDAGRMYSIPKDNPFVDFPKARGETWAYGLRNPWRLSFDRESGQLWTAQNGQDAYEQVYLVRRGENYGWSIVEGNHPFYPLRQRGPTPIVPPAADHPHSEARSLTGGFVYRGAQFPELVGAYIYGDYSTGRIWAIRYDGKNFVEHREIARPRFQITAFFEDREREICLCEHRGEGKGGFFTLERTPAETKPNTFPRKLSDSGLFADVARHRMAPGVIPYSVNASFWSDGAHKERWIAMPAGGKIGHTTNRGWTFPDGTTIVKSFAFDAASTGKRQWHETRFLVKEVGEWYGYSYRWNESGTDAELVEATGRDETLAIVGDDGKPAKRAWHYPSRTECMMCHTRAHNYVLGLCDLQMNGPCRFGESHVNQLAAYESWELFDGLDGGSKLLPTPPEARAKLVDPYDANQPLETRVRSFLHANCSNCHVKEGGGNARMELEFTTAADKVNVVGVRAMHESFGAPNPTLVAPGDAEGSLLLKRMALRGRGQMPPIASAIPDDRATKLLKEWIASLPKAKK